MAQSVGRRLIQGVVLLTCERLATCLFYNDKMTVDSTVGKMYKHRYCETDDHTCARYMVAEKLGAAAVPASLYPNMIDKAIAILEGKGFDPHE